MGYQERERQRLVAARDALFGDPGGGIFSGLPRDFVLSEAANNLWAGFRDDALDYFARNRIAWWKGEAGDPTGHVLSSQVACVNHLYLLRQRPDLATAVLRGIDAEIVAAEPVDDGLVEFEFIGERPYLQEKAFSRGANCTSVDACMIGRTAEGERRAFLIEWKYTERYRREDLHVEAHAKVYDALIRAPDSPFLPVEPASLYFEPFYQLMRQTLLGWLAARNRDHGCTAFRHVHVVPQGNADFHENVTAPLPGRTVGEAWRAVLKQPEHYIGTTPGAFLRPVLDLPDTKTLTGYLQRRYWAEA
ncbi:hypothetical protein JMJ55_10555 [Belnapia sp. T6]|uniref:PD-(D/E)XK nuclease superfamily protein n=1 Tax=Belnapia mucosa TaxID=2804532 RepID=A0ABS1V3R9_9PROT|nr:hypothetical protein [Belnapia mucosa]MBL6455766.1 hypothetical protein [Belnapia mucosa]